LGSSLPKPIARGDRERLPGRATSYSRHLRGATRELRFHLRRSSWRVSYWLAPQRRIVLLTVFRKTRGREAAEVERAVSAQRVCEEQHQAATHVYDREE
jgi:hypothetical protein